MNSNSKNWIHVVVIALAASGGAIPLIQYEDLGATPSITVPRAGQSTPAGAFAARHMLEETNAGWEELNRDLAEMDTGIAAYAGELADLRQKRLSAAAAAMPRG
jgi:hypothetical protein